jgi:hypothetical protein
MKVVGGFLLSSIEKGYNQYREKFRQKTTSYHVFCTVGHLIQSGYMAAQKCFLLFKG